MGRERVNKTAITKEKKDIGTKRSSSSNMGILIVIKGGKHHQTSEQKSKWTQREKINKGRSQMSAGKEWNRMKGKGLRREMEGRRNEEVSRRERKSKGRVRKHKEGQCDKIRGHGRKNGN